MRTNPFNKISLFLIFVAILIFQNQLIGQNTNVGNYSIQNFIPKHYRGGAQNWAIVQDKRGIMFVGNNEGVLEFDGKSWRSIETTNKSTVRSLSIDKLGTIFVGGTGEFGYLKINSNGQFGYNSLLSKITKEKKCFNDIWEIFTTRNGTFFISNNLIFRWHNDEIKTIDVNLILLTAFCVNDEIFTVEKSGIYFLKKRFNRVPSTNRKNYFTKCSICLVAFR